MRHLRYRLGISQETLAERADLHRTYIAGIEGGVRNVTLKSINKLARALQVSCATLLSQTSGQLDPDDATGSDLSTGERVDILMVEDNRDDVELTLNAFKQARITNPVKIAHDGVEALDFLFCAGPYAQRSREYRPQLVLLDLKLPTLDGIEVLRRIKADERTRAIPVVVLTASQDCCELAECRRLGAETYILKPVDVYGLIGATPRLNLNWALLKPREVKPHSPRRPSTP